MEKETYKAAKDLLDKYDPNSEIVKVNELFSNFTMVLTSRNFFLNTGKFCDTLISQIWTGHIL